MQIQSGRTVPLKSTGIPLKITLRFLCYPGEPADTGGAEPVLRAAAGGGAVSGPGAGGAVRPRVRSCRAAPPPALGRPARPDQGGRGRRYHGRLPGKIPDICKLAFRAWPDA
jgi:hypothetical protein